MLVSPAEQGFAALSGQLIPPGLLSAAFPEGEAEDEEGAVTPSTHRGAAVAGKALESCPALPKPSQPG